MQYDCLQDLMDAYYDGHCTMDTVVAHLDNYGYDYDVCDITGLISVHHPREYVEDNDYLEV